MSLYIKIDTQEYPFYIEDTLVSPSQYAEVIDISVPEIQENQILIEKSPILVDGQWIRQWDIRNMTEEEALNRSVFTLIKMAKDNAISEEILRQNLLNLGLSEEEVDSKVVLARR